MGRTHLRQFTGKKKPVEITVPLNKIQVDYLFPADNKWQVALACYLGSIDNHYPKDPLLRIFEVTPCTLPKIPSKTPIEITFNAFTEGPSKGHGALYFIYKFRKLQRKGCTHTGCTAQQSECAESISFVPRFSAVECFN